jgi:hypothetical protein
MLSRKNLVSLSFSASLVHASFHHQLRGLSERANTGGLALNASPDSSGALACPDGTTIHDNGYCCPTGMFFNYDSNLDVVCCPTGKFMV